MHTRFFRTTGLALGTSVLALMMVPQAAFAQAASTAADSADDGEIVVTAQRREELSRDVPITITTMSNAQLEAAGVNQLSDIAKISTSLRFDSQATWVQPTIRGIGTSVTTSGGGANVGLYVDGFYSPNPLATDFQMMRTKSVQVLKGPQGTLFGRNTTGGAVLVSTADPSSEMSGEIRASYGRFNTLGVQGYMTFGLIDGLAMDVEGGFRRGNGYVTNVTTGSKRDGAYKNWSFRTGLKADFSDSVSLLVRYQHNDVDDPTFMADNAYTGADIGGAGTNMPASLYTTTPGLVASSFPNEFLSNTDSIQATLKADLGVADLTSYTQYRTEDSYLIEDLDHSAANIFLIHIPVTDRTFSQEVLLTSKPGTSLQWTVGAFFMSNKDTWGTRIGTPSAAAPRASIALGGSGTTTKSLAAFADLTYEINPQFFLTVGGRYSHDTVENPFYIAAFSGTKTFVPALKKDKFTPRVVLRYKPNDQSSIYASFAKGYKAGILDVGGSTGNVVQPEDVTAFEVGYKFDNRTLSLDLSAYYYDYKNLQVSLFKGNPPSAQIINAANSEIYGLEGQVRYRVSSAFELNAGAAWTHARYKRFNDAPVYYRCTVPACTNNGLSFTTVGTTLTNVTMTRTPEFTANIGARYTAEMEAGKLALSSNFYYTSSFFFGPSGTQFKQGGYEVLSARAEFTDKSDRFSIALFGDNLTGKRYRTQVQYNNFGIGAIWNAPTTYGVQVGIKFP
jgi:iron complex outermembrane receptor protein